jgi:hypothetical protein
MPRTEITKTVAPGAYPLDGVAVTFEDADAANKNGFTMEGNDLLLVRNEGAGDKTFTLDSVQDDMGRTGPITAQILGAGASVMLGPFRDRIGWYDPTDSLIHFEGEDTDIEFAVIKLG